MEWKHEQCCHVVSKDKLQTIVKEMKEKWVQRKNTKTKGKQNTVYCQHPNKKITSLRQVKQTGFFFEIEFVEKAAKCLVSCYLVVVF